MVSRKLRLLVDATGLNIKDFSKKCGIPYRTIQNYLLEGRTPTANNLQKISTHLGVPMDSFFNEEDPMPRRGVEVPQENKDYIQIPLYDVRAAAGHGSFVDSENKKDILLFRRGFIEEELRGQLADFSLIFVDGESMSPTLRPGEIIMVDHRDQTFTRDGVYVMQMDGTLIVKTVRSLPDNQAEIISDNPAYGKFSIDKKEPPPGFRVVGRVVWNGRRM